MRVESCLELIYIEKSLHILLFKSILASVEAGKEILKIYDTAFEVEYKEDDTPLTQADQNASDKIIELLADTNIPVLSEEGEHFIYEKRKLLNELWIVDPLDGTKEFVKRNGEFTVNIALVKTTSLYLALFIHLCLKICILLLKEWVLSKLTVTILFPY